MSQASQLQLDNNSKAWSLDWQAIKRLNITDFSWQHRQALFWPWLALLCLGWVMVASASTGIAEIYTGNAFYFSLRHALYLLLSVMVYYAISLIPVSLWARLELPLLALALVSLVLVFVPGIGHEVNGSRRWLNLLVIKVQASELAKLAAVMYVAGYLQRRRTEVQQQWKGFLKPFAVLGLMVTLLLMEPDFGAVVVLMAAALVQLFIGGVKLGQFFSLLLGVGLLGVAVIWSEPYRLQRLLGFWDPWSAEHVYGSGYQLTQSLIAFGRGEWFGVGLGESIQKLFYLPEAHTDFVFAIWAEETGLFGGTLALLMLSLLVALCWRVAWRAQQQQQLYACYWVLGIATLFAAQVLINIGVNVGLLPTKGLTLPFFSYGGSSLLVCSAMVAMITRAGYEAQLATDAPELTETAPTSATKKSGAKKSGVEVKKTKSEKAKKHSSGLQQDEVSHG